MSNPWTAFESLLPKKQKWVGCLDSRGLVVNQQSIMSNIQVYLNVDLCLKQDIGKQVLGTCPLICKKI